MLPGLDLPPCHIATAYTYRVILVYEDKCCPFVHNDNVFSRQFLPFPEKLISLEKATFQCCELYVLALFSEKWIRKNVRERYSIPTYNFENMDF